MIENELTGKWMTVKEAADLMGCSEENIRNHIRNGRLTAARIGSVYLINREKFVLFMKTVKVRGTKRRGS